MGVRKTSKRKTEIVDSVLINDLLTILPGNVYWKDDTGRYLGCNDAFARAVGFSKSHEIIGKNDFDFLSPKHAQRIYDNDQSILSEGGPVTLEEHVRLPNNALRYYLSKKIPLHDSHGGIIGLLGVSIDITENKLHEERLVEKIIHVAQRQVAHRLSLYSFELLELDHHISAFPGMIYWQDRKGHYLGGNKAFLDYLGLETKDELIGKSVYEFASNNSIAGRITQTDKLVMLYNKAYVFEDPAIKKDPLKTIFLNRKIPIGSKKGEVIGLLCITLNSTEQKIMQVDRFVASMRKQHAQSLALRNNITYLEKIIDSIPANVYWKSKDGYYLGCNKSNLESFNFTSMVGKTIYELLPKSLAEIYDRVDTQVMTNDKEITLEEIGTNKFGQEAIYLSRKIPMHDDFGNVAGMIGISFDITKQKKSEEARQRLEIAKAQAEYVNDLKTEFIMNMSHDIRTPFSAILGFADLLYRNETDDTKKSQLNLIVNSSKKLMQLLDNILFSLKNSNPEELGQSKCVPFTLTDVINNVFDVLEPSVKIKNITLTKKLSSATKKTIHGYRFKLERVLLNLITNAIKFTQKGGVHVDVRKIAEKDNNITIGIQIIDTGIGMPNDQLENFFMRDHHLMTNHGGSGLGLAIVKQFVNDMGGNITVKSKVGSGTTFTIKLAFNFIGELKDEAPRQSVAITRQNSYLSVLLVEDDQASQKLALILLEQEGFKVDVATTGLAAVANCRKCPYDLILMDLGLPDIDGLEASRRIKKLKHCRSVPIVGLTAHLTDNEILLGKTSCLDQLYTKPITPEMCQNFTQLCVPVTVDELP